jgi:hypothetical protein
LLIDCRLTFLQRSCGFWSADSETFVRGSEDGTRELRQGAQRAAEAEEELLIAIDDC